MHFWSTNSLLWLLLAIHARDHQCCIQWCIFHTQCCIFWWVLHGKNIALLFVNSSRSFNIQSESLSLLQDHFPRWGQLQGVLPFCSSMQKNFKFYIMCHFRMVQQTSSTSGPTSTPDKESSSPWLLVVCVFISIFFNIIFLAIIIFTYRRNCRRRNRQLATLDGLSYSRVNNDDVIISSGSLSPTNSGHDDNDDDEPMIDL